MDDIYISKEIGISTESKWTNKYKQDLFQIATNNTIYIFDTNKFCKDGRYTTFWKCLLTDDRKTVVGCDLDHHLKLIRNLFNEQEDPGFYSTLVEKASLLDVRQLQKNLHREFKKPLSKFEKQSNWTIRPLRKTQIHHAALDAAFALRLFEAQKKPGNNENITRNFDNAQAQALQKKSPVRQFFDMLFWVFLGIVLAMKFFRIFDKSNI